MANIESTKANTKLLPPGRLGRVLVVPPGTLAVTFLFCLLALREPWPQALRDGAIATLVLVVSVAFRLFLRYLLRPRA